MSAFRNRYVTFGQKSRAFKDKNNCHQNFTTTLNSRVFLPLAMFEANLDGNEDINLLIVVYLIFGRINVENEQIGRGI